MGRETLAASDGVRVRRGSKWLSETVPEAEAVAVGKTEKIQIEPLMSMRTCGCGAALGYRRRLCDECKRAAKRERKHAYYTQNAEHARKQERTRHRTKKKNRYPLLRLCDRCRTRPILIGRRGMGGAKYCEPCRPDAKREKSRRDYAKRDKAKAQESSRRWAAANRDKMLAKKREHAQRFRAQNSEMLRERRRQSYQLNREKVLAQQKLHRAKKRAIAKAKAPQ